MKVHRLISQLLPENTDAEVLIKVTDKDGKVHQAHIAGFVINEPSDGPVTVVIEGMEGLEG